LGGKRADSLHSRWRGGNAPQSVQDDTPPPTKNKKGAPKRPKHPQKPLKKEGAGFQRMQNTALTKRPARLPSIGAKTFREKEKVVRKLGGLSNTGLNLRFIKESQRTK